MQHKGFHVFYFFLLFQYIHLSVNPQKNGANLLLQAAGRPTFAKPMLTAVLFLGCQIFGYKFFGIVSY